MSNGNGPPPPPGGGGGHQGGGGQQGGGGSPSGGPTEGNPFRGTTTIGNHFSSTTASTTFQTSVSTTSTSGTTMAASAANSEASVPVSNSTSSTRTGAMIGGSLAGILLLVPLLILAYRRWKRNKHHRMSIGALPTSSFRPWKKKEMALKNKIEQLQTLAALRLPYDPKNPDHNGKPAPPQYHIREIQSPRSMSPDSGTNLAPPSNRRTSRSPPSNLGVRPGLAACRTSQMGSQTQLHVKRNGAEPGPVSPVLDFSDDYAIESSELSPTTNVQTKVPGRIYTGQIRPGMGIQRQLTGDSMIEHRFGRQ